MSDNSPWWELIYITVATLVVISFVAAYNEGKYLMLDKVTYPKINEVEK
jgi:hypothetical protein